MAKLNAAAQLNVPETQLCSFERDAGVYQARRSHPIANIALNLQITKNLKTVQMFRHLAVNATWHSSGIIKQDDRSIKQQSRTPVPSANINIALNLQITSDVSSSGRECNLAFKWDYNRMIHGVFCNPTCQHVSWLPYHHNLGLCPCARQRVGHVSHPLACERPEPKIMVIRKPRHMLTRQVHPAIVPSSTPNVKEACSGMLQHDLPETEGAVAGRPSGSIQSYSHPHCTLHTIQL